MGQANMERAYQGGICMLVLSRKLGGRIVVPQCQLTITVSAIKGKAVRLAFSAPAEVDVYRDEVWRQRCLLVPGIPVLPGDRADALPGTACRGGNQDPA
jgi:carbon storage regulator CsrA